MALIKNAGTFIPLFICISMAATLVTGSATYLTWERPLIYFITALSLCGGIEGLLWLMRRPFGRHPSVFIVTMLYQKIMLTIIYWTLVVASLGSVYPPFDVVPEWLTWALFIGCSIAIILVNVMLAFGGRRRWMEQETDPIPFRPLLLYVRRKRDKRQ